MKSYTDLEQSKKLAEILPLKSADMYWDYDVQKHEYYPMFMDDQFDDTCIRAWSLAALLEAMPQSITKYIESERCQRTYHINLFRSYYYCVSYSFTPSVEDDNTLYCIGEDNWVDACYKMILKLNELKML